MNLLLCRSSASFRELNSHQDEIKVDGVGVDGRKGMLQYIKKIVTELLFGPTHALFKE